MEVSPLQGAIDMFDLRIKEISETVPEERNSKRIGELFVMAAEMREGLLDPDDVKNIPQSNLPWIISGIIDFTRILVTLNYLVQQKINSFVDMNLQEELERAMGEPPVSTTVAELQKMIKA